MSGIITRGLGASGTYITRGYGTEQIIAEILLLQSFIRRNLGLTSDITTTKALTSTIRRQLSLRSIIEI